MKTAIIIPIRKDSKRLPNKNILPLNGKPLLLHIAEKALKTGLDVYVLEDYEPNFIINLAKKHSDITFYQRSEKTCTDDAPTELVIQEFLDIKNQYDDIILLQATCPMTSTEDILKAYVKFCSTDCDSLLSVCEDKSFRWKYEEDDLTSIDYKINNRPRTQDVQRYRENGAIYIFSRASFNKYKNRLGGKIESYIMPASRSFDIDTQEDFDLISKLI